MSSIIALQNGHLKVVRNRYSNNYKHFGSFFRRQQKHAKRLHTEQVLLSEARLELDETLTASNACGSFSNIEREAKHPHNLGLPAISLVVDRINSGDNRCGLTSVLQGAKGVSQWGKERVEFSPNNKFGKRIMLKLSDSGRITAAIFVDRA
ncbi:MAG: hypothetical protein IPP57_08205 [Candidatus Obscuribacter sp.]|jgi:hypothetical protein|nr:hypothetical protein [Candidatus Obscuribacter sp.]